MPDEMQLQDKLCRYRERLLMPVSGQLHMPGAWLGARAVHKGAYQQSRGRCCMSGWKAMHTPLTVVISSLVSL